MRAFAACLVLVIAQVAAVWATISLLAWLLRAAGML